MTRDHVNEESQGWLSLDQEEPWSMGLPDYRLAYEYVTMRMKGSQTLEDWRFSFFRLIWLVFIDPSLPGWSSVSA
jgi:hypothetical protein